VSLTVLVYGDVRGLRRHRCACLADQRERVNRVHCAQRAAGYSPCQACLTCSLLPCALKLAVTGQGIRATRRCHSTGQAVTRCKGRVSLGLPKTADAAR